MSEAVIAIAASVNIPDVGNVWLPPTGRPYWTDRQGAPYLTEEEVEKYLSYFPRLWRNSRN